MNELLHPGGVGVAPGQDAELLAHVGVLESYPAPDYLKS